MIILRRITYLRNTRPYQKERKKKKKTLKSASQLWYKILNYEILVHICEFYACEF